jgi:excisionase family DNA binding protein
MANRRLTAASRTPSEGHGIAHSVDPLLRPSEAAAYLGLAQHTLDNWRALGDPTRRIPFVKIGRLVKYRLSALDAYLSRCERN